MNSVSGSSTSLTDAAGPEDADLAGLGVDPDVDVLVAADPPVGRLDGLLDGADELLARDLLLGIQLEEGADEIATHHAPPSIVPMFLGRSKQNVGVTHVVEAAVLVHEV